MNEVLLLILSLIPGVAIMLFIYFKDKHEKEPISLLAVSFVYGVISFFIAWRVSLLLNNYITINEEDLQDEVIHAFLIVALVEEVAKFAFVRFILYKNENFNEPFDGIVYTVMVAMGFATIENIIYVMNGDASTAIVRMFTAVPAHGTFAILMGYYLGKAKFQLKRELYYSILALVTATVIHGTYDYFLFISFVPGIWIVAFVALGIAFVFSRRAMKVHQDASPFKPKEDTEAPPD